MYEGFRFRCGYYCLVSLFVWAVGLVGLGREGVGFRGLVWYTSFKSLEVVCIVRFSNFFLFRGWGAGILVVGL